MSQNLSKTKFTQYLTDLLILMSCLCLAACGGDADKEDKPESYFASYEALSEKLIFAIESADSVAELSDAVSDLEPEFARFAQRMRAIGPPSRSETEAHIEKLKAKTKEHHERMMDHLIDLGFKLDPSARETVQEDLQEFLDIVGRLQKHLTVWTKEDAKRR